MNFPSLLLTATTTLGLAVPTLPAQPAPKAAPLAPVRITETAPEMKPVGKPKELSKAVKDGLEFLVKSQREDGGWNQDAGTDQSDIANTCIALLALVRSGNTPTNGEYKDAVAKGLRFVLAAVEKAGDKGLPLAESKLGVGVQLKFGSAVDTFLTNWLLAELRGKVGSQEKALLAALEKTTTRIVRHQTNDGWLAETGLTPAPSLGLANRSLARARLSGVMFDDRVLERVWIISQASANGTVTFTPLGPVATNPQFNAIAAAATADVASKLGLGGLGDAGATLYRVSQGAGNTQDVVNVLRADAVKAQATLKDSRATREDRTAAQKLLEALKTVEPMNNTIQAELAKQIRNEAFVAGFGSNGGEEFLSFLSISEALLVRGGKPWEDWDACLTKRLEKAQDKNGSWSGHHCVMGKTFCTSTALLVLMTDRTPFPPGVSAK